MRIEHKAKAMKIKAQITITATYDDAINIVVGDRASSIRFLDMTMTREQFINATMNRLGNTNVERAELRDLDLVGKKMEIEHFEFPLPLHEERSYGNEELAIETVKKLCPEGWTPDLYFSSQDSFFYKFDGSCWARAIIRRWVNAEEVI
jgi:hypothetical protein